MKLFPTVRRVVTTIISGGTASWAAVVSPALTLANRIGLAQAASLAPAVALDAGRQSNRIAQTPALSIVASASGTAAQPAVNPAPALSLRLTQAPGPAQTPAAEIVRVIFTLAHVKGGVTATTTGTWTNATNAQGDVNTTLARAAGEALTVTKTLQLDYTDLADKSTLTLTAVRLVFYTKLTLAALNDTTVTFERSLDNGGSWATLGTVTADYDELVAGRSFTLSPLPSLAQVQAIRSRVTVAFPAVGTLKNLDIDAIHLQVDANETWAL